MSATEDAGAPRWSDDELRRVERADELRIAAARPAGGFRSDVPVWVVRVGDELFVRSYRGASASWYRHATASGRARIRAGGVERVVTLAEVEPALQAAIDEAYATKYGRGGYVDAMLAPQAVETSLRLDPAR